MLCAVFLQTGLPCFQTQTDIKELLETLGQNVVTKKRKNVEILWIAGTVSSVLFLFFFFFLSVLVKENGLLSTVYSNRVQNILSHDDAELLICSGQIKTRSMSVMNAYHGR